jgi:predicted RNA polymerase sigma factor
VAITRAQPFNFPLWCRIGTTLAWRFVRPVYPRLFSAHSARADMYRRLGRIPDARTSYEKALALTQQ